MIRTFERLAIAAGLSLLAFASTAQEMQLRNASANVAVNDTLYTLNKGRYEVGKIGENDLLKSELALLRARAAVDDAKLARDRAEAALRRLIAYPDGQPFTIVTPVDRIGLKKPASTALTIMSVRASASSP